MTSNISLKILPTLYTMVEFDKYYFKLTENQNE